MIRSVVDPLPERARMDVRYIRAMRCVHAERYLEYCHDFERARRRGDWGEMHRIIEALSAFSDEMHHLVAKHRSAWERLVHLMHGTGFAGETAEKEMSRAPEEA